MSGSSPSTASTNSSTVETVISSPPAPPVVPLAKPKATSLSLDLLVVTLAAAEGEDVLAEVADSEVVKDVDNELGESTEDAAELASTLAVGEGPSA